VRLLADLALGRAGRDEVRDEFCVRFQQTCGPVMAKGVEDTAFYRWFRLSALNEVGGDPGEASIGPDALHAWAASCQARQPSGMTALSTHDTKRSEDVRARLAVLSELPGEWAEALARWRAGSARHRSAAGPDAVDEVLMWQTVVGAWPISPDRLTAYLEKAAREGKRRTSWVDPDPGYEDALRAMAERVLADPDLSADVARFVERVAPHARVNALGMKLVQLTLPGVADTYQGTELVRLDLVDPDNRRPVDYDDRRRRLARLDAGEPPRDLDDEKLLVTSRTLRLRAAHPLWFAGPDAAYAPLPVASGHALAFLRGGRAATVATRLSAGLEREGGWGGAAVVLPDGRWRDAFTGAEVGGAAVPLALLLDRLPVALLVRGD
jgi:(1->4)-alpha-D-glucan 1-alpha-D-glucosylmutase